MKNIAIIGATGSIGTQTLSVIREHKDKFNLVAFSVGYDNEFEKTCQIIEEFSPLLVCCIEDITKQKLETKYQDLSIVCNLDTVASFDYDIFVNSVVGSVGLLPTVTAIKRGKTVCLANKETLVVAGDIIMPLAKKYGVNIFPIDSEHSAIFQCLNGENPKHVKKLILTASGGSFRNLSRDELANVTLKDALNHPNWSMGKKITIDSATMMNKGLEIIEAHHLFGVSYDDIEVVIHYESAIHSMVEFCDNSVIAQLGTADMSIPIGYALSFPERLNTSKERFSLTKLKTLNFKKIDFERFPCVKFAYEAGRIGHTMPACLNACNEVCVEAFLNEKISFLQIEEIIEKMLSNHQVIENPSLDDILETDKKVRKKTREMVESIC